MKKKSKSVKRSKKKEVNSKVMATVNETPKEIRVVKTNEIHQPKEVQKPVETKKTVDTSGKLKIMAIVVLFGILIYLVFLNLQNTLQFGPEIDQESFKEIFASAENVYIIMDVRNTNDPVNSNNVLQCGVDFAASSGMGGKTVVPMSFSNDGCVTPTGTLSLEDCTTMLKDGITVYVKAGNEQAKYYNAGMVVSVGSDYTLGACSINVIHLPVPVPQEGSNSTESS
ncbi:MAG: hypothetical protein ABID61_03105 [Candidatus Micrarchaeota archaeon]